MRTGPDASDRVAPAIARARELFLDDGHAHGCAETALVALKEAFGLPDPADASAAMALNGGVAYRGGVCGAISGSAIAVGQLVAARVADQASAKRRAREVVAALMDEFEAEFGSVECRALLGRDIRTPEAHAAFIESGIWRTACMAQLEFVIARLSRSLDDPIAGPAR
jgi:C_GCAxxG_C_C family probable redox protein